MSNALLSVVIANYNYGRFLEDAIKSVLNQSVDGKVELIICDAASTDDSVQIIKKYANGLPPNTELPDTQHQSRNNSRLITWWCSEKDGGQSDAFNKGFSHAHGKFLTWLNADDVMAYDAIEKLSAAVSHHPECEWFIGGCCWLDPSLKIVLCTRARPLSRIRASGGDIQAYGPSSFFSRELFERVGGYVDERFHYMMDIELWNRFYHQGGASYQILPGYVWGFRMHPEAKTSGHRFAESDYANPENPIWEKRKHESELNASMYCSKPITFVRRVLSVSWRLMLLGKIDSLLRRGQSFFEIATVHRESAKK